MSINRICPSCKSTFSLSTTECPRCSIPLSRYKVRVQREGKTAELKGVLEQKAEREVNLESYRDQEEVKQYRFTHI